MHTDNVDKHPEDNSQLLEGRDPPLQISDLPVGPGWFCFYC